MWIERLRLRQWRNFRDEILKLKPGLNGLCGDNGAGKTNCLEALGYLSRGHSFRGALFEDLTMSDCEGFSLEVLYHSEGIENRLTLHQQKGNTIARFNGQPIKSWRGIIPTVLWLPQDGELVKGAPAGRRGFLDDHLVQCDPLYAHHSARYARLLKQRNHLLRFNRSSELTPWNQQLAKAGGYLMAARQMLITSLEEKVGEFFAKLASKDSIQLHYRPAVIRAPNEQMFSEALEAALIESFVARTAEELRWSSTLSGPHRDDFEIRWNGERARHFVSNGQAKLCSAGFKIAEWRRLQELGLSPVLLIDEFGSGLDETHRRSIWQGFLPAEQILVACTTLQKNDLTTLTEKKSCSVTINKGEVLNST